ncbi:MAG: caspase domain-containing protein [Gemmatimonadales bacterium]
MNRRTAPLLSVIVPSVVVASALALLATPHAGLAQGFRSERIGAAPAAAPESAIQRYVFAGVAIDTFRIPGTWPTLANAVNDLEGVRSMLVERYGFTSPDRWILTDTAATQDAIGELLDELGSPDPEVGIREDDALVFFYAGHGTENLGRGFLVPHDVTKAIAQGQSQYLSIGQLVERLGDLPARHVLLILDSCKSGLALTSNDGLKDQISANEMLQVIDDMARNKSRIVVTSAASNQSAADAGGPAPDHSLFTGYLLEGLRLAAEGIAPDSLETEGGRLVTTELFEYVQERVATVSAEVSTPQTPTFGTFLARGENPRGQLVLAFDVDPFADAYAQAVAAHDAEDYDGFRSFYEQALAAESEADGPRAQYLRYLAANAERHDLAAEVAALRRLVAYPVAERSDLPLRGSMLRIALDRAESQCASAGCAAASPK